MESLHSTTIPEASEFHHVRLGTEVTPLQPVGKKIDCRALLGFLWLAVQIVRGSGGKGPLFDNHVGGQDVEDPYHTCNCAPAGFYINFVCHKCFFQRDARFQQRMLSLLVCADW
jgi:hypothetical protein